LQVVLVVTGVIPLEIVVLDGENPVGGRTAQQVLAIASIERGIVPQGCQHRMPGGGGQLIGEIAMGDVWAKTHPAVG